PRRLHRPLTATGPRAIRSSRDPITVGGDAYTGPATAGSTSRRASTIREIDRCSEQRAPRRISRGGATMGVLNVPDAQLYYETRGTGPLLIMIPGASGDARTFTAVSRYLEEHYTVITYDRRGFSRSPLDGPQDYHHRLTTDADDVARLIEHHGESAAVFGTSSGAVIALTVLPRHPNRVSSLAV